MLLTTVCMVVGTTNASAQKLGGLQIDVGSGVQSTVRESVHEAASRAGSSGKWTWIPEKQMRAAMPSASRDCFTTDCLISAGKASGADGGIRVRITGESQIFDWTIDVYDLHTGKLASTEKGACELCGAAEVRTEFEASARAAVAAATITPPTVATKPKVTPPREDPAKPPVEERAALPPLEEPPPLNNPMAGLVTVEILVTPADASVSMGGQEIGRGAVTVSLEPGSYQIQFAREGYGGLIETLVVGADSASMATMRVHLAKTDPDAVYVDSDGPMDRLGPVRKTYGIVGLAAGGVLLGTGIWLAAIDGRPTCGDRFGNCPRIRETSAAAFVTTVAGAFLVTGGAVFLAWDALSGKSESEPSARIVPVLGPDSAGLGFVGRF